MVQMPPPQQSFNALWATITAVSVVSNGSLSCPISSGTTRDHSQKLTSTHIHTHFPSTLEMPMKIRHLQIGANFLNKSLLDIASFRRDHSTSPNEEEEPLSSKVYQHTDVCLIHQIH